MLTPHKDQFFKYEETGDGVLAVFDTAEEIKKAATKTRDKGYKGFDCYTPYPVHGLEDDMGLARSGIPWITLVMGAFGCVLGFGVQYLTHVHDWPLNVAGKALNAWYAFIPVTFEATVFWAGLSTAFSLFVLGGMPKVNRKILNPRFTSDKFGLWIPSSAQGYSESEALKFAQSLGAQEVKVVKEK